MAVPQASWTILATLRWTADYFRAKGVPEARASAEILLAHTLGVSRLDLYLRYDQPLNPEELARFKALMIRRREGEPVAYLTGHREFWSLDIRLTPAVLIPRPETETLVAAALEAAESVRMGVKPVPSIKEKVSFYGIGQGKPTENRKPKTENPLTPGAWRLASAAVRWSSPWPRSCHRSRWVGLDSSGAALAVARDNARRHVVLERVHFLQADLPAGLKPTAAFALLVAACLMCPGQSGNGSPREIKTFEPPGARWGAKTAWT